MARRKLIKICFERQLNEDQFNEYARRAIEDNPRNIPLAPLAAPAIGGLPPGPVGLALLPGVMWKPGSVLRCRFLGGEAVVQAKVEQVAHTWEQFANIKFAFGDDPQAEIRVAFISGAGSWSYLGMQALGIPKDQPTLNLGWLQPNTHDDEYNRVVLHEFGHALGCIHEHQNPATNIPWNKPAVYRSYGGPPNYWTQQQVDVNLFQKYSADQTQFSDFDPQSIMLYPISKDLTDGKFEVGFNTALSTTDKSFIGTQYPFDTTPIVDLTVGGAPAEAEIGQHGEEDFFRFSVNQPGNYVVETGGRTDVVMGLYGPDDRAKQIGYDDDSGVGLNARIAAALQPGTYYVRVRHYRPTAVGKYSVGVVKT